MNPLTRVSTLMTETPITILASAPLSEAGALFAEHNIHHLPVVNAAGALIGMLSQSDFYRKEENTAYAVGDLMTRGLAKLEPTDTVRTAAGLFALNRFHALPVVDEGRLLGILTTLDLMRLLDKERVELSDYREA